MTLDDILIALRAECKRATSMRKLADEWGVSFQYIAAVLARRVAPGPKVLKPMGYERVYLTQEYRKIESQEASAT